EPEGSPRRSSKKPSKPAAWSRPAQEPEADDEADEPEPETPRRAESNLDFEEMNEAPESPVSRSRTPGPVFDNDDDDDATAPASKPVKRRRDRPLEEEEIAQDRKKNAYAFREEVATHEDTLSRAPEPEEPLSKRPARARPEQASPYAAATQEPSRTDSAEEDE